jgi:hypothetical protein
MNFHLVLTQLSQQSNPDKNQQRINRYSWGLSVKLGILMAKYHSSDVDMGSYPRLLALTEGSWYIAWSHQPVVNGVPLK